MCMCTNEESGIENDTIVLIGWFQALCETSNVDNSHTLPQNPACSQPKLLTSCISGELGSEFHCWLFWEVDY